MENFVLSCCSTADLSLEHFQNRNIHYICFHYELNGTVYPDDLGQSMPFDVYEAMTKGAETKTFQVNVAEFEHISRPFCRRERIFCIFVFPPALPACYILPTLQGISFWRNIRSGRFIL